MVISKAEGQTLKSAEVHPQPPVFFARPCSLWQLPYPPHLTTSLLHLLKDIDSVQKIIDLMTSHTVYREVL